MSIDLKTIADLREKTGAGVGDCKAALEEAGGNIDQAVDVLRKKGEIKAAKKSDRATKEGVIAIATAEGKLAAVGLACETDFVALTDDFSNAVKNFAAKLLEAAAVEDFKNWAEAAIKNELVVKVGENMQLGACRVFNGSVIGSYLHSNKKVAAVVVLDGGSNDLADDIAMQVAAMSPKYLDPSAVPAEVIDKEKEIYREQLKSENKPEAIHDKIIEGKLNKFYEENCLLSQIFIKDDSKKIKDLLGGTKIVDWDRFQL